MSIRRGIIPGVVAIGLLVACSPSAGPPTEPTPTTSRTVVETPTPTPTPTPSPTVEGVLPDGVKPERPAALGEAPTAQGAFDVLTYYLLLVPYAQNTGDLAEFTALSDPVCEFCSSVVNGVSGLQSQGVHSVGGGFRLVDEVVTEVDPGRWFSVDVTVHEEPSQEVNSTGAVVREYPAAVNQVNAIVLFEDGRWLIRGLDHELVTP